VRIPEAQDGRGHLVTTPTESHAAVCRELALYGRRCESATNGRLCTACAPAAAGDEIERLARELWHADIFGGEHFDLRDYDAMAQWVARLVRRKELEAERGRVLSIVAAAKTCANVERQMRYPGAVKAAEALNGFAEAVQSDASEIAAELAALEEKR
jgi:hypothetical protein